MYNYLQWFSWSRNVKRKFEFQQCESFLYQLACDWLVWAIAFDVLAIVMWQLVQFLLKQAGVEKRTGDLFGNRDLLNIARNMARGLKVCVGNYFLILGMWLWILMGILDLHCRGLKMSTPNTSLSSSKPWKALSRGGWKMWTIHM